MGEKFTLPAIKRILERSLLWLLQTFSNPLFALVVVAIMGVLVEIKIVPYIIGGFISIGAIATILLFSFEQYFKKLLPAKKILVVLLTIGLWVIFGYWALEKYNQQRQIAENKSIKQPEQILSLPSIPDQTPEQKRIPQTVGKKNKSPDPSDILLKALQNKGLIEGVRYDEKGRPIGLDAPVHITGLAAQIQRGQAKVETSQPKQSEPQSKKESPTEYDSVKCRYFLMPTPDFSSRINEITVDVRGWKFESIKNLKMANQRWEAVENAGVEITVLFGTIISTGSSSIKGKTDVAGKFVAYSRRSGGEPFYLGGGGGGVSIQVNVPGFSAPIFCTDLPWFTNY
jgi:hypothetical protein